MSPAENWIVNDDFLPEGIVSGAEHVKKIPLLSVILPGNSYCGKVQDESVLHHKKNPYHTETAVIDHCFSFYHLLHQHEGCLH